MKVLFSLIIMFRLPAAQPQAVDRHKYCESCLTVAQEIEKALKEAPAGSRQTVVENLLSGAVCETAMLYKHGDLSDKKTSFCSRLLDNHYEKFHAALLNKEPQNLDIILCYEQSTACVGVKRQSFTNSKASFKDSDIETILQNNKRNVRFAQPIHKSSRIPTKYEL